MSHTKAQIQRDGFRPSAVRAVRHSPGRNSDSETFAHHSPVLFKQKGEFDDIRNSPRVAAQRQQLKGAFGHGAGSSEKNDRAGGLVKDTSRSNKTGMPDRLKAGVETLSGLSLDDVRVQYDSTRSAQLNALAYARGSGIHVAPGQEQHLPHEAWHVVQQAHGGVQPALQMKDGVSVNDDAGLEHEAGVMGAKVLTSGARLTDRPKDTSYRGLAQMPDDNPQAKQPAQLYANVRLDGRSQSENVVQREQIAGTEVVLEGGYPCFSFDGKKYHIDETKPKHVTCDSEGRTHYYFEGSGQDIVGIVGPGKKKKGGETKKFKFEQLPSAVQQFIKQNYDAIVSVKTEGTISL